MKKQWVLVCVLAGALMGSHASAQHKAPNTQPSTTEAAPASTTGEATLGTIRIPKAVMADGREIALPLAKDGPTYDPGVLKGVRSVKFPTVPEHIRFEADK